MKKGDASYQYIIAIGISTGGPKALNALMSQFDRDLPATYIIVQHMPSGFTKSLAQRLDSLSGLEIKEAEQGDILVKGKAFVAPGGKQLKIVTHSRGYEVSLTEEEPYKGHRPSVNVMLNSLAQLSTDKKMIAVIMTGMGSDGLEGVSNLVKAKQTTVIAQDEASCVVYGMPKAIVNAHLAEYVVPLEQIASTIIKVMGE
ncbi:MAG: CheB methylesterase domain-containing protein [Cellulosilyticaceae bacterium]